MRGKIADVFFALNFCTGGPENPDDLVNGSVKNSKLVADSHTDSVLGLSWNVHQKNVLASCSADKSVKLWDLMTGSCIRTYKNHKDKVKKKKFEFEFVR